MGWADSWVLRDLLMLAWTASAGSFPHFWCRSRRLSTRRACPQPFTSQFLQQIHTWTVQMPQVCPSGAVKPMAVTPTLKHSNDFLHPWHLAELAVSNNAISAYSKGIWILAKALELFVNLSLPVSHYSALYHCWSLDCIATDVYVLTCQNWCQLSASGVTFLPLVPLFCG